MSLRQKRRFLLCHRHPSAKINPHRTWSRRRCTLVTPAVTAPKDGINFSFRLFHTIPHRLRVFPCCIFLCFVPLALGHFPCCMLVQVSVYLQSVPSPRSSLLYLCQSQPPLWQSRCRNAILMSHPPPTRRRSSTSPPGSPVYLSSCKSSLLAKYFLS